MNSAVIQITSAARILAELRAKNAVKDQIRKEGHKVSQYTAAEITGWARPYVEDHPALRAQALDEAKKMILAGLLGKRAQKAARAELTLNAQTKIEPLSMGSAVQMSGAK